MRHAWVCLASLLGLAVGCGDSGGNGDGGCPSPRTVMASSNAAIQRMLYLPLDESRPLEETTAARSDGGIVCITCLMVDVFDRNLDQRQQFSLPAPKQVAVAPDDTLYVAVEDNEVGHSPSSLAAFDASGLRWETALADSFDVRIVAGVDGAYVQSDLEGGSYSGIQRFDPLTGAVQQLTTSASDPTLLGLAPGGGVLTVDHFFVESGPVTVSRLDATGAAQWALSLAASEPSGGTSILITGSAIAPDGRSAVIFGNVGRDDGADTDVTAGSLTITAPAPNSFSFVLTVDSTGQPIAGFGNNAFGVGDATFNAQGQLLLYAGSAIAVASPTGITSMTPIPVVSSPRGHAALNGLVAGPDNTVWLQIDTDGGSGDPSFVDVGTYLVNLDLSITE